MTQSSTSTLPRLEVTSLAKSFFGVKALSEVSFAAYSGEVLGVVGENGSGKSTTMNILSGIFPKDSGTILLDGFPYEPGSRRESEDLGVAFIQQELNIFPNLTVAENIFLGRAPRLWKGLPILSRSSMHSRARELLQSVDLTVDPSASAGSLTAGERQLLEIARALSTDAKVVIFDEPTTSLTQREIERLFGIVDRLRKRGVAIIYISHALQDVLKLSDRIIVLRDGQLTQRFDNRQVMEDQLVTAMVGRSIEALFPQRDYIRNETVPILELGNVNEPGVASDISLQVGKGEIVGLWGLMGAGRSELARIIFGLDRYSSGDIRFNGKQLPSGGLRNRLNNGMAFLTEDRRYDGLLMEASVAENVSLAALPMYSHSLGVVSDQSLLDAAQPLLRSLTTKYNNISMPVRALSGGNQQKVLIVRWLLRKPVLFILDEPTRGVDVGAKEDIYRLLAKMAADGMAILLISSELEELTGLCDRILVMHQSHINARFDRDQFEPEALLKAAFGQAETA